jgi:hypothetical protein
MMGKKNAVDELTIDGRSGAVVDPDASSDAAPTDMEDDGVKPVTINEEAGTCEISLRDPHSLPALLAYGRSCKNDDRELSATVLKLAERAGKNHPANQKQG